MWQFHGKAFSWEDTQDGQSIALFPEWHQLEPNLGGPSPDLEVEEVLALSQKALRFKIEIGGFNQVCDELRAQSRLLNLPFKAPANEDSDVVVNNLETCLEIVWYRTRAEIEKTVVSLTRMCASTQDHSYQAAFRSRFLVGEFAMGTNTEMKNHFLNGDLGAALVSMRSMSFACGHPMPRRPPEHEVLQRMQKHFF